MLSRQSSWSVALALVAIALFGTVGSLLLQRMFGNHIALAAIGPVICVFGVLIFMSANTRNRKEK